MSVKKYIQAQRDILFYIANQKLQVNDCLPDEGALSEHLGVSSITTRRAMRELVEAGIIERIPGKGTFLRKEISQADSKEIFLYVKLAGEDYSSFRWDCDLAAVAADYGYRLKTISCQRGNYEPLLEELANVAGILISGNIDAEYVSIIKATNLPFVVLGEIQAEDLLTEYHAQVVAHDWYGGGRVLTEHFIQQGARRIALLNGAQTYAPAVRITAGYRDALEGAGLAFDEDLISWSKQGYWGIKVNEFFKQHDWRQFDAVIADPGVFPHLHTYMLSREPMLETLPVGVFRLQNDFHPALDEVVALDFEGTLASRSVEVFAELAGGRLKKGYQRSLLPVRAIQVPGQPAILTSFNSGIRVHV